MHIYEVYLIEKIKKKILFNFIEKSISKIPNLLFFFLSHSFFQHFRTSSHINYKIAKGKIFLICHSIKFANKSIELEKRDTKIFDLKDLTISKVSSNRKK